MIYITRGLLNGAGDATFAFMNGIIEMLGRICFAKAVNPDSAGWSLGRMAGNRLYLDADRSNYIPAVFAGKMEKACYSEGSEAGRTCQGLIGGSVKSEIT